MCVNLSSNFGVFKFWRFLENSEWWRDDGRNFRFKHGFFRYCVCVCVGERKREEELSFHHLLSSLCVSDVVSRRTNKNINKQHEHKQKARTRLRLLYRKTPQNRSEVPANKKSKKNNFQSLLNNAKQRENAHFPCRYRTRRLR